MNDIKHGHRITTEAFYDGNLMSSKQELEVSILSSAKTILTDLIDTLDVISRNQTNKLTITILVDNEGKYRIVKKWTVK
jgi:hypothetical protein